MRFPRLTIAISPRSKVKKSRTFRSRLVGHLTADALWELGRTSSRALRPVWLAFFNTVGAAKPFTANLRAGRSARTDWHTPLQVPKKSTHHWSSQVVPGGIITVAYLPELFHLDPPAPFTDGDANFVVAPTRGWVEEQAVELEPEFGDDGPEAARAALFAAYLDRRTPYPLLRDLRFHLQLYRAALDQPWVTDLAADDSPPSFSTAYGLPRCGFDTPLVCSVHQEDLGDFLTEQTSHFHRLHGPSVQPPSPLLDLSGAAVPTQLALDLVAA